MNTPSGAEELSLYLRLGGYDRIAAIIDHLFTHMRTDPRLGRFATGRSTDSRKRGQQLTVDLICSQSGGPCYYFGRDMKASHAGLGITEAEWEATLELTRRALQNCGVVGREQAEFLSLFERYKKDIVEVPQAPRGAA